MAGENNEFPENLLALSGNGFKRLNFIFTWFIPDPIP